MNIITLLLDVLLTIPLTFIMMKIDKNKKSFLHSCLIPTIYIIIIAALVPSLKKYIFLIPIFELFIRNFYLTNINEEIRNNKKAILSSIISILLVLFTYNYFISKVTNVLPTPEEVRPFIWLIIIIIIYSIANGENIKGETKIKTLNNKNEYIAMQYGKYKTRYDKYINSKNNTINKLIYSLIIFKNYQQPTIYRNIKNYTNHLLNKEVKYGVLEVASPTPISDEESITKTIKKLETSSKKMKDNTKVDQYLTDYTEEEIKEIVNIYNVIDSF